MKSLVEQMIPVQNQLNETWYEIQQRIELDKMKRGKEEMMKIMQEHLKSFLSDKGETIYNKGLIQELIDYDGEDEPHRIMRAKVALSKNKEEADKIMSDFYEAKILDAAKDMSESERNAIGVTTARKGHIAKYPLTPDQAFNALPDSVTKTEKLTPSELKEKYPDAFKLIFKDPYYPFPKPGELYACGKQEAPPAYKNQLAQLRGSTKPLGQVEIHGTGGDFDIDKFKDLWENGANFLAKKGEVPEFKEFKWHEPSFWPKYDGTTKFSTRMGFVDMAKGGVFEEYIGTYKRKMLLLL